MGKQSPDGNKYMATVKVGPKGQIVIPKEARDMFGIQPGDSLILLADREKGIAVQRLEVFSAIADAIFDGKAKTLYPDQPEEDSENFARSIRSVEHEEEQS